MKQRKPINEPNLVSVDRVVDEGVSQTPKYYRYVCENCLKVSDGQPGTKLCASCQAPSRGCPVGKYQERMWKDV
jgi:rRNA maturation endonuclease Nob1